MDMVDIIFKKREGGTLSRDEIQYFINGLVSGEIPDYQASALLMAAFLRGLDSNETAWLTAAMSNSGDTADFHELGTVADKHSTGGVADTTTLLVVPLVCACGLKIAKMSGRGLGHTGGTLDKLESIPGLTVALDMPRFTAQVRRIGAAVMGQTLRLCPADKILYALRDVTATVDSMPLIASSIMSKKLAAGADVIMLDVKTGNGAFMPHLDDAIRLAQTMVDIGRHAGRHISAIISDMSQPLGRAVGNTLEVIEAIDILNGHDGGDLLRVSLALASRMLIMGGIVSNEAKAMDMLHDALQSGRARDVLKNLIDAQDGDSRVVHDTSWMPRAPFIHTIHAKESGCLAAVDCRGLGIAAGRLGAGRLTKDDTIDLRVGFICHKRIGDHIDIGDALFDVHAASEEKHAEVVPMLEACLTIGSVAKKPVLIHRTIV